jgi:copper homeostasis protein
MGQNLTLEICVDSLGLALAAARGGADRIELCGPLHDGGITPSAGLAAAARRSVDLPIAMLVRSRTGAFTATADEFEVMRQDVLYARSIGMNLVVLGILHEDRTVDIERTRELVECAGPMEVTFHRAFDAAHDLKAALRDVKETGATRILTSGGRPSAVLGAPVVHDLLAEADDQIGLLLCGGISSTTVRQVLDSSGVHEVHAALRSSIRVRPQTGSIPEESLEHFADCVSKLKEKMHQPDKNSRLIPA